MDASVLLVAVDAGPRATLAPLAVFPGFNWVDERNLHEELIRASNQKVAAIVVGTSESMEGRELEAVARTFARATGVRLVVVEDYPGNYRSLQGGCADLLIVESSFSEAHYRAKLKERSPPMFSVSPMRYDPFRARGRAARLQYRAALKSVGPCVLWIGQPETEIVLGTLEYLCKELSALKVRLLFKAHPRDQGYASGMYKEFFSQNGDRIIDLTGRDLDHCLSYSPLVALTQFSSMVLEAGFFGVPSIHLLYEELAGELFINQKGYSVPPWCEAGASGLVTKPEETRSILSELIGSERLRQTQIAQFDKYFNVDEFSAKVVFQFLRTWLN